MQPGRPRIFSSRVRGVVVLGIVVLGLAAVTPLRHAFLRGVGQMLMFSDVVEPVDLLAMDVESGAAGALTLSDLFRERASGTLGLLRQTPTRVDGELARRGVVLPDFALDTLVQLGVPPSAIIQIPAGDGGTTESTAALAAWARDHAGKRVLVVVGPSHGRRYRRALRRAWPNGRPPPTVVTTPYGLFRPEDWWQSRVTLREGLVELEKLALDYAAHPW